MKNIKKGPRVLLFILWEVMMKISGCDLVDLKKEYGTPLYIFDRSHIKRNIDGYLNNFKSNQFETEVLFASKAFNVKEMIRVLIEKNMSLDCVSKGELYTALKVGFDPKKVYYHGNNKSKDEESE